MSFENFQEKIGFPCSLICYLHIRKATIHAITKYNGNINSNKSCNSISTFMAKKQKGSHSFRKILGTPRNGNIYKGMNIICTYFSLIDVAMPDDIQLCCSLLGIWNFSFWPIKLSTFIYQLYSNSLPVAARLANRYRNVQETEIDERCFWNTKDNFNAPGRETFCHVFFEHPTSALILTFRTKCLMGIPEVELKPLIIAGIDNEGKIDSISQIESILLLFCIWEGKLRKRALSYYTVES